MRSDFVVVSVLRAGLAMLHTIFELLPTARAGHIGLQPNETTATASTYYSNLPTDIDDIYVLLIDSMLAGGGSAGAEIDRLTVSGERTVCMISIVAVPEGVALVEQRHPDVVLFAPMVDRQLNARK